MSYSNNFLRAITESGFSEETLLLISKKTGIPSSKIKYYNNKNIIPSGDDLQKICSAYNITELHLQVFMGLIDLKTMDLIKENATDIIKKITESKSKSKSKNIEIKEALKTDLGTLYQGDCIEVAKKIKSDSVDLVFADPPFNLDKIYPSKMDDNLKEDEYLIWCQSWISECIRILKPGGSFFLWNLPIWNSKISTYLHGRLSFKHWISTDIKLSLPIQGRLYPSHYSLLYFIKGEKANYFNPDRLPAQVCPKCFSDLKDYGGYKNKMNPKGISLTDIWLDIPPVRHKKYKKRDGSNELSVRLLDRVIEMSTKEGDLVFDPFGGSGTTYAVAEIKGRKWIGSEIDDCDIIKNRFLNINDDKGNISEIRSGINNLFPDKIKKQRILRNLWTDETFNRKPEKKKDQSDLFD